VGLYELCSGNKVIDSLSSAIFECTYTRLETDSEGFLTAGNAPLLIEKSKNSRCMLIGCGLGHTPQTEKLVAELVINSFCPLVIDADGINSLAANIDVLQKKKSDVILTPHPMELARLGGKSLEQVLSNRLDITREIAEKYGVTLLSKSAESFAVNSERCILTNAGCTALSKGGSGDLLAGITASLIAQGCKPVDACAGASFIMGSTAQLLCEHSSPRSILPTDIAAALGMYFSKLEA
jgi:NAD(P)H-hydrate epimerase